MSRRIKFPDESEALRTNSLPLALPQIGARRVSPLKIVSHT